MRGARVLACAAGSERKRKHSSSITPAAIGARLITCIMAQILTPEKVQKECGCSGAWLSGWSADGWREPRRERESERERVCVCERERARESERERERERKGRQGSRRKWKHSSSITPAAIGARLITCRRGIRECSDTSLLSNRAREGPHPALTAAHPA